MMRQILDILRKNPIVWIVTAVCICVWEYFILLYSPNNSVAFMLTVLAFGFTCLFLVIYFKRKEEKMKEKSISIDDSLKEFLYLDELVRNRLVQMGEENNNHIHKNWLITFHIYFVHFVRNLECNGITDFHVAAAVIYSLVWSADSISHTDVIYQCVRELIFKPKVYDVVIDDFDVITLKVKETLPEKSLSVIPVGADTRIAEVIMRKFIIHKDDVNFMKLAKFLKDIYENLEEGALENLKAK